MSVPIALKRILYILIPIGAVAVFVVVYRGFSNQVPVDTEDRYYETTPDPWNALRITKNEAYNQVANKTDSIGFETIFFPSDTIEAILNQSDVMGIKFFTAQRPGTTVSSLIAIGVKQDGSHVTTGNTPYKYSNGVVNSVGSITSLSQADFDAYKANANASYSIKYVYFCETTLKNITNFNNQTDGLNLRVGQLRFRAVGGKKRATLIAVPAQITGSNTATDISGPSSSKNYFESKMPCPPDCKPRI